jgi:hypothetical protein
MRIAVALLVCLAAPAHADPQSSFRSLGDSLSTAWIQRGGMWWLSDQGENGMKPPPCQTYVDELNAANVPDTATFDLQSAAGELKAGKHTFGEAKASCDRVFYVSKVKTFVESVYQAMQFADEEFAKRCVESYELVTKAGVKPDEVVPKQQVSYRGKDDEFGGTIESLRIKYCDPLYKKVSAEKAKREAPYRAVLKGDKLNAALSGRFWMLPGKIDGANSPKLLAANNVWFYEMTPADGSSSCSGKTIILYRWQFDPKTSKFLKATEKSFCGDPPKSAYR